MEDYTVGIVGYGRLGAAFEYVLSRTSRRIIIWDADPARVRGVASLDALMRASDIILLTVPSWSVRGVVMQLRSQRDSSMVVASFAKGIETGSLLCMDEVLHETLGDQCAWAVAGGPVLAEELTRGGFGALIVASPIRAAAGRVASLFEDTAVRVAGSTDTRGVAIGGALKNIYAAALGVARGVGLESNVRGVLLQLAMRELSELGVSLGGRRSTLEGLAGVGDLLATVESHESKNRALGERLVREGSDALVGESIASLAPCIDRLTREAVGTPPLLTALASIVLRGSRPAPIFRELMARITLA